jgi:hypothetical protein
MNREEIISFLEKNVRKVIMFLYSWITTDGEILGHILGLLHFLFAIMIFTILFLAHTLYPRLWLQGLVLLCMGVIWVQHIILKVCIYTVAEENFTKGRAPFFGIVNDISNMFGIPFNRLLENILVAETTAVISFSLVFIGKVYQIICETYLC